MSPLARLLCLAIVLPISATSACSSGEGDGGGGSGASGGNDWISDNPIYTPPSTTGDASVAATPIQARGMTDEPPTRVEVVGDRLLITGFYGFQVVDISQPAQPRHLGRFTTPCAVEELFVRDASVTLISACEGSVHVQSIDASDPTRMIPGPDYVIPGALSSAVESDGALYVVATERCSSTCSGAFNIGVRAFDISSPGPLQLQAQLDYGDADTPKAFVGAQRLYMTSWPGENLHLKVLDHSDPSALVLSAELDITGPAPDSNWHLSEHNGALRVLSGSADIHLDSFVIQGPARFVAQPRSTVRAAANLDAIAFDGDRAFLSTNKGPLSGDFELIALDLSDPSNPTEVGALALDMELSGVFLHGNRLLGFGGAIRLFDVGDLGAMTELSRVADVWWTHASDSRQIVPPDPSSGGAGSILYLTGDGHDDDCDAVRPSGAGGIDRVSWTGDKLSEDGFIRLFKAQFALQRGDILLGVTTDNVHAFDASEPSAPVARGTVSPVGDPIAFASTGSALQRTSGLLSNQFHFDVVPSATPDAFSSSGLTLEYPDVPDVCDARATARLLKGESETYLLLQAASVRTRLAVIDVNKPAQPRLVSQTELQDNGGNLADHHDALLNLGELAVRIGTNVGFLHRPSPGFDSYSGEVVGAAVVVVDAANPAQPLEYRVELPGRLGNVGLFSDAQAIYTTHYEPLANDPSRVRFYLDRITPQVGAPPTRTQLQIPGAILALGQKPGQMLTVDYRLQSAPKIPAEECWDTYPHGVVFSSSATDGLCWWFTHEIQVLDTTGDQVQIVSRLQLQDGEHPGQLALGDDVLFMDLHPKFPGKQVTLLSGLSSGTIQRTDVALPSPARERAFVGVKAQGKRGVLFVNDQLLLVDSTHSSVTELALVPGGTSLQLDSDAAYLIAYSGLERFELPAP